ncbi:hypothetical protein [Clostridium sp. YIM B02555]|jgi:hypothetical protein|uniref:hypothetical protein n=1 Tax=Clostridium sp. YIM B02555 TaxID=2911968 RepID=UPI001EED9DA3|nr:hypothetical protein [Clostridium sp. YIM B02555]
MTRAIFIILVGLGSAIEGIFKYGREPSDTEKTGLTYQYFGSNGVSVGMILLGICSLILGFLIARHEWKNYKNGKSMNLDI